MTSLVLGTAGHIDHGKSALVEALTGTHPDRLKEEEARGITIELGFAHAMIGDVSVALVDVPGHERFVRTMLAGAAGLDAVLLIVAANESVMPQTREHFAICRLLGIDRGIIVLTKRDLVDADTLALVELDVRELVAGTPLTHAPVIAVSAHTGAGLEDLRAAIAALGTSGVTGSPAGVTRMPIDRVFSVKGFGTVVTGTLVTGALALEQAVTLLPGAVEARVRGLQVHGKSVDTVTAPRRVAVNLGGVDLQQVRRGMTLAAPDALPVTRRIDAHLELLPGGGGLRHGARVRLHQGTSEVSGRISLAAVRPSSDAPWVPVRPGEQDVVVPAGGQAFARVRFTSPMVLARGDRIVLRFPAPARTIGGGVVLDPAPPRGGVRRAGALTRFARLHEGTLRDVVQLWADEAGLAGITIAEAARRAGVPPAALTDLPQLLISDEAQRRAVSAVTDVLAAFHAAHPTEVGMAREEVRARAAHGASAATFDAILAAAQVDNTPRLALRSHRPAVDDAETRARAGVVQALLAGGLQPPDVPGLVAASHVTAPVVTRVLQALGREGLATKVGEIWFHADALSALKAAVRARGAGTTFDVAAAKAQFGVSRKFAIPLLEFLDRERVTRRVGDRRLVL